MLYIMTFLDVFMAFCRRKSKVIKFLTLFLLIFIMGFSSGFADFLIYESRYNFFDVSFFSDQTEPGYTLIMKIFNYIGLNYRQYLFLESIFITVSYVWFMDKMTKNINYVLSLYIIWPFCWDASARRTSLAVTFLYFSFYFYLKSSDDKSLQSLYGSINSRKKKFFHKHNLMIFTIFIIISGTIHYGMLFFMVLIIPGLLSIKKKNNDRIIVSVFLCLFLIICSSYELIVNLPFSGTLLNKIQFVIDRSSQSSNILLAPGTLRTLFMFFLYFIIHLQVEKKLRTNENKTKYYISKKIFYINLYQLLVIPFFSVVPDLWRLQQVLMILNYVEFSYFISDKNEQKYTQKEIFFIIETIGYAFIYLFIMVLNTEVFDVVLRPLFENNIILK